MKRIWEICQDNRGIAALEFAMILPILMLIIAGVYDYGRYMWFLSDVNTGLRAGMHYALTAPNDSQGITNTVVAATTAGKDAKAFSTTNTVYYTCGTSQTTPSYSSPTTCGDDGNPSHEFVKITITYSYNPLFNVGGLVAPPIISATLYGRVS